MSACFAGWPDCFGGESLSSMADDSVVCPACLFGAESMALGSSGDALECCPFGAAVV